LRELRPRTHENQQHRSSGQNLVVATIVLWDKFQTNRTAQGTKRPGLPGRFVFVALHKQQFKGGEFAVIDCSSLGHINPIAFYVAQRTVRHVNRCLMP
jgi:hypothetical protein